MAPSHPSCCEGFQGRLPGPSLGGPHLSVYRRCWYMGRVSSFPLQMFRYLTNLRCWSSNDITIPLSVLLLLIMLPSGAGIDSRYRRSEAVESDLAGLSSRSSARRPFRSALHALHPLAAPNPAIPPVLLEYRL